MFTKRLHCIKRTSDCDPKASACMMTLLFCDLTFLLGICFFCTSAVRERFPRLLKLVGNVTKCYWF